MRKNLFALVAVCFSLAACDRDADVRVETINGIVVPPAPDPATNQATLSGVDSNSNGVRDDVERLVAEQFGTDPTKHSAALTYARTEQAAIVSSTPEAVAAHVALINCIKGNESLSDKQSITLAILDTAQRRAAYAKAFAGAVISSEECSA